MADLNKKFLDYGGLSIFLSKLQEYITGRIMEINGSNINAFANDEDNPLNSTDPDKYNTISSQLQALWEAIGVGGDGDLSITEKIENIIGEYVKTINEPASQELPLKIQITEGTGDDNKGRFTIGLVDNGLGNTLSELSENRVTRLETPDNPGGIATLSIDKHTGNVKLTLNTEDLQERLETIEGTFGEYLPLTGGEMSGPIVWRDPQGKDQLTIGSEGLTCGERSGNIINIGRLINVAPGDGSSEGITIGSGLTVSMGDPSEKITLGKGRISIGTGEITIGTTEITIKTSETTIGTTGITIGNGDIRIGDRITIGSAVGGMAIGRTYINDADIRSNKVTIGVMGSSVCPMILDADEGITVGSGVNTITINDSGEISANKFIGNLEGNATSASDSDKLDGHDSSYFATKEEYDDLKEIVEGINTDLGTTTSGLAQEKQDREAADTALGNRITEIEESYVKSIKASNASDKSKKYVTITPADATTGDATITINDSDLTEKIESIDSTMALKAEKTEIPTKLPTPQSLTISWKDTSNTIQTKTHDGSDATTADLTGGVYYAKTSTDATNATYIGSNSNNVGGSHQPVYISGGQPVGITIENGSTDTENCLLTEAKNSPNNIWSVSGITANYKTNKLTASGGFIGNLQGNADTATNATNASKLGNQTPDYYATKEALDNVVKDIETIQGSYVKSVTTSNGNTDTQYVTITQNTAAAENVTITIDDTAVKEKFESIDDYTINGKKISTSPTLTGDDITLGKSVGDNTNYPTTMDIPEAIQKLRETITGLGKVVNLSGVYEKWEDYTSEPNNGDFVIVGQKEYVYWEKWIELGDTTQVTQYLNELIAKYNTHTHTFSVSGSVESSFAGTTESHSHTFTGNSVATTNNTISVSYGAGKLTINTSHNHTVTPTGTISNTSLTPKGTITSSFSGNGVSSETNSTQGLPPVEPGAPDSFNPGGGEGTTDYSKEYFTIEALEDGLTAKLSANACEYRIDDGEWISLAKNTVTPSINSGQKISFKITNPSITLFNGMGTFTIDKAFNIEGNIMSLLYGDSFEGQIDLSGKNRAFYRLFKNCTTLKNVENLILPATTLADFCYADMFYGCTSLTSTPELPATTLANKCYMQMFYNCTSLTTVPELPATTLTDYCYQSMFGGCTGLTTAPELPVTTLASSCYQHMFSGCTSLTSAPELPATALADACYEGMFSGCTSLTSAPELPATTLVSSCYNSMFYNCSNLNNITMLATNISASNCLNNWVYGVASTGKFVKASSMTSLLRSVNGIPERWTVVNDGEE